VRPRYGERTILRAVKNATNKDALPLLLHHLELPKHDATD